MNVLHIAGKMDPRLGGVAQAIRTIVSGLESLGLYNEVVTLDDPKAGFLQQESMVMHQPGEGQGPWYYSAGFTPWLQDNLMRFDIIVVHGLWQFHGYTVQKMFRRLRKKGNGNLPALFIMPHGMLDPYFQAVPGRTLKAVRNWLYWRLIETRMISGADGVLFTCLEEKRLASHSFKPYKPQRQAVAGLGVAEPPTYTAAMKQAFLEKCPAAENRNYVLFLGRIDEKKGVDLLVNAYSTLFGQHKNLPLLIIAGPGLDTPYGEKIKQLVNASAQLCTSVLFTGMLNGDAKWGAFYCAEAFVLPSHQENFGIALVEAMACNKPVLISNKVNIWQEVINGGGGLVEDDTLEGTYQLLRRWNSLQQQEQKFMGAQARECFEKQFSIHTAAHQFMQALVIENKSEPAVKYLFN